MKVEKIAEAGSSTFWRIQHDGFEYGATVTGRGYGPDDTIYSLSCGWMSAYKNDSWTSDEDAIAAFCKRLSRGVSEEMFGGRPIT